MVLGRWCQGQKGLELIWGLKVGDTEEGDHLMVVRSFSLFCSRVSCLRSGSSCKLLREWEGVGVGAGEGAKRRGFHLSIHKSLDSNLVPPAPGQVQPS